MDISIYHRDQSTNELGFDAAGCSWSKLYDFSCVDMSPLSEKSLTSLMQISGFEATKHYASFWINSQLQSNALPYVFEETDYIAYQFSQETDEGLKPVSSFIWFYKILNIVQYEIFPGCCEFKVIGERLEPRECSKLAIECGIRTAVDKEKL